MRVDIATIKNKYNVIYASPPWIRKGDGVEGIGVTTDEICTLPIADLAAEDSVLFLWASYPLLKDAMEVIDEWGFGYKQVAYTWIRPLAGSQDVGCLYRWIRADVRVCLMATRGNPKNTHIFLDAPQIICSPMEQHHVVRDMIANSLGDSRYIELYARDWLWDWDRWGNDAPSNMAELDDVFNRR